MQLKVVQLNLWKGKFLDEACDFLKKESPDIICMQEVTTYELNFYHDQKIDLFDELKSRLGFSGVYDCVMKFKPFPKACFGNAIFSRFPVLSSKTVSLKDGGLFEYDFEHKGDFAKDRRNVPRHLLDVEIELEGEKVHVICVHGAWTAPPEDNEETLSQADVIAGHIKSLGDEPFVVGGDFNMPPESKVIAKISDVAVNLMAGVSDSQTLNPRVHILGNKGFLVDYIFCSKHFSLLDISVPQVDVSDHLPVVANLTFGKS